MHPVGAAVTFVVAASALYRTITGKREALTFGLWAAAFALSIIAFWAEPLNASLNQITGLGNLARLAYYFAMVISSYLIARMSYRVARIESYWPILFTVTSIVGMIAFYCGTDLHNVQRPAIDSIPGAASAWFAIFYVIGLLPTHIAAIIGVLSMTHKNSLMVWLLAIYGGVGAIAPVFIVANHIGTVRPISFTYLFVWITWLISFGALSLAGVISTHQAKQIHEPAVA
jgi:hypothetical protein